MVTQLYGESVSIESSTVMKAQKSWTDIDYIHFHDKCSLYYKYA